MSGKPDFKPFSGIRAFSLDEEQERSEVIYPEEPKNEM
jgi:hypothetical protein